MRFRSANPVFSRMDDFGYSDTQATYAGVTAKTGLLLAIIVATAMYFTYSLNITEITGGLIFTIFLAPILGIISVIMVHRASQMAFMWAIIYSLAEGVFLGFISAIYAAYYSNGIIVMAMTATFAVFAGMLFLYSTGLIRVGEYFRRFLFTALIGLIFASLVLFLMAMLGGLSSTFGFSFLATIVVISVIIASLYLLVDFDNVTRFVEAGAPKETEWMLSIGLVVTIVWLYVELLRLIAIFSRRR